MERKNLQLEYLKEISNNLFYADINLIKSAIKDLKDKPIPLAILNEGHYIDRVCIESKDFRANEIQRLSYIKDENILKQRDISKTFGRANLPNESLFYGSVYTDEIKQMRVTAFLETSSMPMNLDINEEYFTVSRWQIKKDIKIIELVFQKELEKMNNIVKNANIKQKEFMNNLSNNNENENKKILEQLEFFSNEFAKYVKPNNSHEYKITAAFASYLLNRQDNKNILGLAYPSVQSGFFGLNIALTPFAVDNYLEFANAVVMKAERDKFNEISINKSFASAIKDSKSNKLIWTENIEVN